MSRAYNGARSFSGAPIHVPLGRRTAITIAWTRPKRRATTASIWKSGRNPGRGWRFNLVAALVASRVIGAFEGTIDKLVALAALMPFIASVGGNTGNQTAAIVIRGLAPDQIGPANLSRFLLKEVGIGLMNGSSRAPSWGSSRSRSMRGPRWPDSMARAMALNLAIASVAGEGASSPCARRSGHQAAVQGQAVPVPGGQADPEQEIATDLGAHGSRSLE